MKKRKLYCLTAFMLFFLNACGSHAEVNVSSETTAVSTAVMVKSVPTVQKTETIMETKQVLPTEEVQPTETDVPTESTEPTETVAVIPERIPEDGELVRILDYIPDAVIDLRYATTNNFTGTVIYDVAEAYLCYGTIKKLIKVQDELKENGFRIIVWDPYRPEEAQERLWEVCPNPTYVADPRNGITSHSRGNTIDLGIVYEDGSEVELPSGFDEFSLIADRDYSDVSQEAADNSRMLEDIMVKNGFKPYWGEWWHYSDLDTYEITNREDVILIQ
ncbi:MAG: M15 family metallopeptidase [Oscillospiraceae bacterium]